MLSGKKGDAINRAGPDSGLARVLSRPGPAVFLVMVSRSIDCTFVTRPQPRDGGDYLHRARWPAQALGELIPTQVIQLSHPGCLQAMAQARVLVLSMLMDPDLVRVMHLRRQRGLVTVYEISDDFMAFPQNLPLHRFYQQEWVQDLAMQLCGLADAVQFSSPRLAEKFGSLNATAWVMHNQAVEVESLPELRAPGCLRVGWAGSAGHAEDVQELIDVLRPSFGLGERRRFQEHQVSLEVMTTPLIASALAASGLQFQRRATGDMRAYNAFLAGLDVGIACVGNREFALGRSDGKFIEYASRGVVAVCSRRGTYAETVRHGETGLLFETAQELQEHLRALHHNPELRNCLRRNAHHELRRRRNHRVAARERLRLYQELYDSRAEQRAASPCSPPAVGAPSFSELTHPIERELLELMMGGGGDRPENMLSRYLRLMQQQPEFYRIWDAATLLYRQLGLTENLAMLERGAEERRQRAFELAFHSEN